MAYIIGISGGSGSGKTTFVERLQRKLEGVTVCFVTLDHYYKAIHLQPKDINGIENFDKPESLDIDAFMHDLSQLLAGKNIFIEEYNFNNPKHIPERIELVAAPVIVIEGIFLYAYERIMQLLDLKIFIEAPYHIRLKRRMIRDTSVRGYTIEDVLYRLEHQVEPAHMQHVEPFKQVADIIVMNNPTFDKGLEVVADHILAVLARIP